MKGGKKENTGFYGNFALAFLALQANSLGEIWAQNIHMYLPTEESVIEAGVVFNFGNFGIEFLLFNK